MDNNKTLVLEEEPKPVLRTPENFDKNHLNSLSSNKTTVLADKLQADKQTKNENTSSKTAKPVRTTNIDKQFSSHFKFNHSNALIGHAIPVLSFINRIRTLKEYDPSIFQTAKELLGEYIQKLKSSQIKPEIIQSASYILCMTIDEVALKCSWSYASPWISKGILDSFFQQSQDDGYFINLLEYYYAHQNTNRDVLEIFGICLSICTKGQSTSKVAMQAENLRHKILTTLKNHYPLDNSPFSPHAVPPDQVKRQITNSISLWIIAAVCCVILSVIYIGFRVALSLTTEPVYNRIIQLYQPNQIDSTKIKH
ncbi:MAG: type IVB secretion system protein IcmH/DotU [Bdellovibrionota bacterium]